jgi:hypothetical protein
VGFLVALSDGPAAMADDALPAASSLPTTPLRAAGAAVDTEEQLSNGEDEEDDLTSGEANNGKNSDAPGGDRSLEQSRFLDRDVLHACGAVLIDFVGESLCLNFQLLRTREAVGAIPDALRGGLDGDMLVVSGAAAASFSPLSSAAAVSLHVAYT